MAIIDIFTYNGEEDLLEIRLNILNDSVDQFIIVEASNTFSGNPKPLYFERHQQRFLSFMHKIKYFVINDYPNDTEILALADLSPNVPHDGPEHWKREFYQKESIKKALTHLNENDVCFISDVDEIWNPSIVLPITIKTHKLCQKVYAYFLNNCSNESWTGTLLTSYKTIKNHCLNHLRTHGDWQLIDNGGWHFTSIGGLEEVRRKLNDSYTSDSYNTIEVQRKLSERFGKKDYIGRSHIRFHLEEDELPKYVLDHKEKYIHLFKIDD